MLITDRWGDSLHYEDPVLRLIVASGPRHTTLTERGKVQLAAVLRGQVERYRVDDVEAVTAASGARYVRVGRAEVELEPRQADLLAEVLVPGTVAAAPEEPAPKPAKPAKRKASSSSSKRSRTKGKKRVATKSKSKQVAAPKKGSELISRRSGVIHEVLGTTTKTKDGQRRVRLRNEETGKETLILPSGIPNNYERL